MEKGSAMKRAQEFLADFPDSPMSQASRIFLRENPLEWVASRNRLLVSGLLNGDQETVDMVIDDVTHVVGKTTAEWWKLNTMEKLVFGSGKYEV